MGAVCSARDALLFADFENPHLRVANGVGKVVRVYTVHVCFALTEIESFDVVLLSWWM